MDETTMKKMQEAKSVEEILSYAKENGITLTEEQAKEIFARVSGVLSDEEIEEVAAGAIYTPLSRDGSRFLKQPR